MKLHSFLNYLMLTYLDTLFRLFRLHVVKEECLDFDTDTAKAFLNGCIKNSIVHSTPL